MSQTDHLRLTLRLPKKLADYLQGQAEQNVRSLNGEIVKRLEQSRDNPKGRPKKE